MECQWCGKSVPGVRSNRADEKLYDLRGFLVCWDCYWEDVDKDLGKEDEGLQTAPQEIANEAAIRN